MIMTFFSFFSFQLIHTGGSSVLEVSCHIFPNFLFSFETYAIFPPLPPPSFPRLLLLLLSPHHCSLRQQLLTMLLLLSLWGLLKVLLFSFLISYSYNTLSGVFTYRVLYPTSHRLLDVFTNNL